jgi:hypothetical protein
MTNQEVIENTSLYSIVKEHSNFKLILYCKQKQYDFVKYY